MSTSTSPAVDCMRLLRRDVDDLLALKSIVDHDRSREIIGNIDKTVTKLEQCTSFVQLSELTIDTWPATDGDDELVTQCFQAMYRTNRPRPSDVEGVSLADLTSSDRVRLNSGLVEVPLTYDRPYIRNWGVLFDFIETELSVLDEDLRRIKRRIAADGDERLREKWEELQQRVDLVRAEHERRAEYFSPADKLPKRIRERE